MMADYCPFREAATAAAYNYGSSPPTLTEAIQTPIHQTHSTYKEGREMSLMGLRGFQPWMLVVANKPELKICLGNIFPDNMLDYSSFATKGV